MRVSYNSNRFSSDSKNKNGTYSDPGVSARRVADAAIVIGTCYLLPPKSQRGYIIGSYVPGHPRYLVIVFMRVDITVEHRSQNEGTSHPCRLSSSCSVTSVPHDQDIAHTATNLTLVRGCIPYDTHDDNPPPPTIFQASFLNNVDSINAKRYVY